MVHLSLSIALGPFFNVSLGMAEEDDKNMAENWKADADALMGHLRTPIPSVPRLQLCQFISRRLVYSQLPSQRLHR